MSNWLWPIKALFKLKADLTKPAEDITGMAKDTHKGFGKILYAAYGPWVEKRLGEAKRIEAQAERDAAEIKDGISKYDIAAKEMISLPEVSSIDALCAELESVNSALKAKRLAAAIMAAAIEMKQIPEEEVADEPLNQTFFNHWRAEAELIDDEDLRQWWAHLLVEETKKPHSISPRTLDVAKNLSKEEVECFQRLFQIAVEGTILVNADQIPINGTYYNILLLQEAGLIGQISSHWQDPIPSGRDCLIFVQNYVFVAVNFGRRLTHRCHLPTNAGRELMKMLNCKPDLGDLKRLAKELSVQNANVEIRIYNLSPGLNLSALSKNPPLWSTSQGNKK